MEEHKLKFKDNTEEILYFDPIPHKYYWNEENIVSATGTPERVLNAERDWLSTQKVAFVR